MIIKDLDHIPLGYLGAGQVFQNRVAHGDPLKSGKIDLVFLVLHSQPAGRFFDALPQQLLGKIHHAVDVHVGAIEFEHREFRIVLVGDALVAEVAVELVNLFETADDEAFQIKLGGDAGVKRDIERVMMRLERLGGGAGRFWREHRRFDLDIAVVLEKAANGRDNPGADFEDLAGGQPVVLDLQAGTDQIGISLPLANLGIRDAVHFVGHRQHRLRQKLQLFNVNGKLAGIGDE